MYTYVYTNWYGWTLMEDEISLHLWGHSVHKHKYLSIVYTCTFVTRWCLLTEFLIFGMPAPTAIGLGNLSSPVLLRPLLQTTPTPDHRASLGRSLLVTWMLYLDIGGELTDTSRLATPWCPSLGNWWFQVLQLHSSLCASDTDSQGST